MYKFAIIGCGRIASRHAENIIKVGQLVAVCDIDKDKADSFAKQYDVKAYYSIDDLLKGEESIDIVSICSPNGFHAEHSIKSLQSGKHVLCEKPMCLTTAAAWQIIETEKFTRKRLFIVKSTRYNPLLQRVHNLLTNNKLGEVFSFDLKCFWNRPKEYYKEWRGKSFPDGGTLYTQFSHYIDAMLWLFGEIKEVKGFASNKNHKGIIDFEDTGSAALIMQNNVLGSLHWSVNTFEVNSEICLTIIAEHGTICIGGPFLNEVKYIQSKDPLELQQTDNIANDYGFYKGSMSKHKEVYNDLMMSLRSGSTSLTNGFDGMRTVEAIEKIYKSISTIE